MTSTNCDWYGRPNGHLNCIDSPNGSHYIIFPDSVPQPGAVKGIRYAVFEEIADYHTKDVYYARCSKWYKCYKNAERKLRMFGRH